MTAEVAIMNRIGVALAADSALTIGGGKKTHSSADKLFQLSRSVGVMVHGSAVFLGVPWETIIKEYRRELELGEVTFATVEEYAGDFFRFMSRNEMLFPKKDRDRGVLDLLWESYEYIFRVINGRLGSEDENLTPKESARIIEEELDELSKEVRKSRSFESVTDAAIVAIRKNFAKNIGEIEAEFMEDFPVSIAARDKIQSIGIDLLRKYLILEDSGIIFAGFGNREAMPSMHEYKIHGMVGDELRVINGLDVTASSSWGIFPFGQTDDVRSFLGGIHPDHHEQMRESTVEFIDGIISSVLDVIQESGLVLSKGAKEKINSKAEDRIRKLFEEWDDMVTKHYDPVIDMSLSLPKSEMAFMAEALVNLAKFRTRVASDLETVGGPIDVALITRGDGFVWIKRKQYFDPTLNPP